MSKAHIESNDYNIDPCYSHTAVVPSPVVQDNVVPIKWVYLYGDGELESYRLSILRKRAKNSKLKVWYPGDYHETSTSGWFRIPTLGSLEKLDFCSNGQVRVVGANKSGERVILYNASSSSRNVHRVTFADVDCRFEFVIVEVNAANTTLGGDGCGDDEAGGCADGAAENDQSKPKEPVCIYLPQEELSSAECQWSLDSGKTWSACNTIPAAETAVKGAAGLAYPHQSEEPTVVLLSKVTQTEEDGMPLYDFGVELLGHVVVEVEVSSLDGHVVNGSGECAFDGTGNNITPRLFVGESTPEVLDENLDHQEQSTELVPIQNNSTTDSNGEESVYTFESANLLAFRYARITLPPNSRMATSRLVSISCRASFHPVQHKGAFSCTTTSSSDDDASILTRIWMNASYTLRLCLHDFILDGIKRDRLPWTGDLAVSLLSNAYTFADGGIVARTLTVLGRNGIHESDINGIVDYSLWWIICQHLYQLYYGDMTFLRREYLRIESAVECLMKRCDDKGFLKTSEKDWVFIDWVEVEKATALQILWWWAIGCASCLAKRLNKSTEKWDAFCSTLREQLLSLCWDEEAELWLAAPNVQDKHSRHANILAVVSGLQSSRETQRIRQALLDTKLEAVGTPYMKIFECTALSRLNAQQTGLTVMKDYWGGMLQKGASTFWEAFDPSESDETRAVAFYDRPFGKSLCHAWSAGPCFYLPTAIFGIRPVKDGWREWTCNPNLHDVFSRACATIPTPHGSIEVEIENDSLTISIPNGTVMCMGNDRYGGPKVLSMSISHEGDGTSHEIVHPYSIEDETIEEWSKPFRNWHHYSNYAIPPKPNIRGFHDIQMTDVPTVYQIPGVSEKFYMSFIGFDGSGYQSFVAESGDLVNWSNPRLAFGYGKEGEFDYGGRVLGAYLYESYEILAPRVLKKIDGKFWSLYGAYSKQGGYELDPGYQGVAWSSDGIEWHRAGGEPILSVHDEDVKNWEKTSIYQPFLVEHDGTYYNFYNAKQDDDTTEWCEQIGLAQSNDLLSWKRNDGNPILRVRRHGYDEQFCADGKVYRDGDHWVMIYFGVTGWTASILVAYSRDLVHWTADPEPLYRAGGHPFGLDSKHAHKVSLVLNPRNGTFYMYYCAVCKDGRGIALLTSKPLGPRVTGPPQQIPAPRPEDSDSPAYKKVKYNKVPRRQPHVILILADDLGFSDVGCFGSEIETPNIDALAYSGIRFTQMYNCARCCPSRASLLTGLYPHQAGVGHMVHDSGIHSKAYQGYLRKDCATIAEIMKSVGGYKTLMTGKWHVGGEYPPNNLDHWKQHAGDRTHPTPYQRGFDEHYGTLGGGGSYYDPPTLIHNEKIITLTPDDYYYTDSINDEACRMIHEAMKDDEGKPFFLYVSHTAPHWPLHAPQDVIDKYRGRYKDGWDQLRERRHEKLREQGIVRDEWKCSPRDDNSFPWEEAEHKDWEDAKMATFAAQIDVMDQGIGRIVDTLKECNIYDDTMIIFLSDNGGCAEFLKEDGGDGSWTEDYATISSDKTKTIVGNNPNRLPGDRSTFMSYGLPWANASNSPFRLFKSWVHEGGISTPFLISWPNGIVGNSGRICHTPWILMDIVATIYHAAGIHYPTRHRGTKIPRLEGESFLRVLRGDIAASRHRPMFWEHQGNRAFRQGKWKLVNKHGDDWELFDMHSDRTELNNLADQETELVKRMIHLWEVWAKRCEVHMWPLHPIPKGRKDWAHLPWLW